MPPGFLKRFILLTRKNGRARAINRLAPVRDVRGRCHQEPSMNITSRRLAALLTSCFVCLSFAQDRPDPRSTIERRGIVTEKTPETYDLAVTPIARPSGIAAANT